VNSASHHARDLLATLAELHRECADLNHSLSTRPGVRQGLTTFNCVRFRLNESPCVDLYLDVECESAEWVAWRLELTWSDTAWRIDATLVGQGDRYGQKVMARFCDEEVPTLAECLRTLRQFWNAMRASVHQFDFASFR
jgi:hypothetical protein